MTPNAESEKEFEDIICWNVGFGVDFQLK